MAVVPEGGPEGTVLPEITPHHEQTRDGRTPSPQPYDEKNPDIEVVSTGPDSDYDDAAKIYVPDDSEEFIDPRLKDCTYDLTPIGDHDTLSLKAFAGKTEKSTSLTVYLPTSDPVPLVAKTVDLHNDFK